MFVNELFNKNHDPSTERMVEILDKECSQFLKESEGVPLFKNLSTSYGDFHRVKVRVKKKQDALSEIFNKAFQNAHTLLKQRAIFSNGYESFIAESGDREPYYIFPTNGYKYLFNPEIESSNEHTDMFNKLSNILNDEKQVSEAITELLTFTYKSNHLVEGISSGAEILFFNIPYYYAVKTSKFESYDDILTLLNF